MSECQTNLEQDLKRSSLFQDLIDMNSPKLTSHAVMIWASVTLIFVVFVIGGCTGARILWKGDVGSGAAWCFGTAVAALMALAGVGFTKQRTP